MFGTPRGGQKPVIAAAEFLAGSTAGPGRARDFDGVAPHPYAAGLDGVIDQVGLLRDEIERAGDDARLWITELGWASGGSSHPLDRGPRGQAERLRRAFRYFLERRRRMKIEAVAWYSWRDSAPAASAVLCDWCPHSGLLEQDGTAKPALAAFSDVAGAR